MDASCSKWWHLSYLSYHCYYLHHNYDQHYAGYEEASKATSKKKDSHINGKDAESMVDVTMKEDRDEQFLGGSACTEVGGTSYLR